jgi:adsorption protein B
VRLDYWLSVCLVPVALWILLSGLDDVWISLVSLFLGRDRTELPADSDLEKTPQRRIAIFVPLWHEDAVIGRMLDRNLAFIDYDNYEVFAGVYPNDSQTRRALAEAAGRHPRVHIVHCPHDGPTSKGDCLNWIYRSMEDHERRRGVHFDVVVTHDAEDLIHPESLRIINFLSREYQMVQIPVLPLPTGLREFTHGLYCDEFAEYQSKDIPVRQLLGGFLPSNGVGTGFERAALERLASQKGGQVFDPACLTEDYENGYRLHALGCRQRFVPLRFDGRQLTATREYFPRTFRRAVRQRSRWVAGIVLQGWQLHGWRAPRRQLYWFWRDRKGLIGNLLAPFANVFLLAGITAAPTWMPPWILNACRINLLISLVQACVRATFGARIYGWRFACGVPVRLCWGNLVNFCATVEALCQFTGARLRRRRLAWRKTEHVYPSHHADAARPRVGDILVHLRCLSMGDLKEAVMACPSNARLGEYLVQHHKIEQEYLYQALSIQTGLPLGVPAASELSLPATRLLPADAVRRWKVLPYRVSMGQLHLVTPEVPSEATITQVARFCALEPRFRLVEPSEFDRLASRYLPG